MKIRLDITKSLQENAEDYFQSAKKSRSKIQGAQEMYAKATAKFEKAAKTHALKQELAQKPPVNTQWYHAYRWSKTRNGHLVVAGMNASSNEAIIKKHADQASWVLHTDMAGSPFALVFDMQEGVQQDLEDAATIVAAYSRGWKSGYSTIDVFYVKPDQVSKRAQAGENLPKGAFMIRGDTQYVHPKMIVGIGVIEHEQTQPEAFIGSVDACKKHCSKYVVLSPGAEKTSAVAKQLHKQFGVPVDDLVRAIPAGGVKIVKHQK